MTIDRLLFSAGDLAVKINVGQDGVWMQFSQRAGRGGLGAKDLSPIFLTEKQYSYLIDQLRSMENSIQ